MSPPSGEMNMLDPKADRLWEYADETGFSEGYGYVIRGGRRRRITSRVD
jgi:hypothetical protein